MTQKWPGMGPVHSPVAVTIHCRKPAKSQTIPTKSNQKTKQPNKPHKNKQREKWSAVQLRDYWCRWGDSIVSQVLVWQKTYKQFGVSLEKHWDWCLGERASSHLQPVWLQCFKSAQSRRTVFCSLAPYNDSTMMHKRSFSTELALFTMPILRFGCFLFCFLVFCFCVACVLLLFCCCLVLFFSF